jgi:two-component system sensor histidine kinase BaeS
MTAPAPRNRTGTAALRLTVAFAAVAFAAVALLAGLVAWFATEDVSLLASRQRSELTAAIAVTAGAAYDRAGGWASADLMPVLQGAARVGASTEIRDRAGRVVAISPSFTARAGSPQFTAPVTVRGQQVGLAVARFTGTGLGGAREGLRSALLRAIIGATGLAALLALVTGLAVARRITRPVEHLIAVARAMGLGDRSARAGQIRAPAELQELASAFDQMAASVSHQEQLHRNLVADVAHELRTPIAVLQAGHEALLDGVAEPAPAQLASLRDEVLRLGRMVADLQTLAAAEAAALHLRRTTCDLAAIAAEAADSMAARFEAAGIRLERELAQAGINADPYRLHQVVTNLLTNALKFAPAGGRVTVRTAPRDGTAVLQVIDTGVGIPASDVPRIFERFWRGSQAPETPGSGIGLAVAAELTRAHGGQLTATSEPGQGTTMTLTLPRS